MARRLRVVIQSHAGREGPAFTIALTPDVFTICVVCRPVALLATSIPVGFSANRKELVIEIWDLFEYWSLGFGILRP
jgi:hypothetical protein